MNKRTNHPKYTPSEPQGVRIGQRAEIGEGTQMIQQFILKKVLSRRMRVQEALSAPPFIGEYKIIDSWEDAMLGPVLLGMDQTTQNVILLKQLPGDKAAAKHFRQLCLFKVRDIIYGDEIPLEIMNPRAYPEGSRTCIAMDLDRRKLIVPETHTASRKKEAVKLLKLIARGGMSSIYEAHHEQSRLRFAVKEQRSTDDQWDQRFMQEGSMLQLWSHPNIVQVFAHFKQAERLYILMQLVKGKNLMMKVKEVAFQDSIQILNIFRQIASGLAYVHDQGYFHRDIKPDNILMDKNNTPHITDFNFAKATVKLKKIQLTRTGDILGTISYMAPEQITYEDEKDIPYDYRVDIYALGVSLYECLVGKSPFPEGDDMGFALAYAKLSQVFPDLPESTIPGFRMYEEQALDTLIKRMTNKDPDRRIESMEDIITEINRISNDSLARRR